MERIKVLDLDELSRRWQIPVDRIQYLIAECGMDPFKSSKWIEKHTELFLAEKQKAFEDLLFPERFRSPA